VKKEVPSDEKTYRTLFDNGAVGVAIFDLKGAHLQTNQILEKMLGLSGDELTPSPDWTNFIPLKWRDRDVAAWKKIQNKAAFRDHEVDVEHKSGKILSWTVNGGVLEKRPDGNHLLFIFAKDVGALRKKERELDQANRQLKSRVQSLARQVKTQAAELEKARREIRTQRKNLKRVNDAMQILIVDFQEQKRDLEHRVVSNFQLTVEPLMEQLRDLNPPPSQQHLLDTLDFSIKHITSYFGINVASKGGRLTPREIEISQLIGQGQNSRQIAQSLGLSPQTVIVHRKNIRKKLGIKKTQQNLATFITENL